MRPCEFEHHVRVKPRDSDEVIAWMRERLAPGEWGYYGAMTVYMNDPDIAFECRIRWG